MEERQHARSERTDVDAQIDSILEQVKRRDPHEEEFIQAVKEVLDTVRPLLRKHPLYIDVARRMVEPERVIQFRVAWLDDKGRVQVNRGYRVQFNSAIGPYKGGLRFHPSVTLSVMKFLGFEQIFKNSLTTMSLGGGKGGSDFDPKGKSDNEVMKFCQSFMTELHHHIGANVDVPAGDIGVGSREIGYLYGQYKRLTRRFEGSMTGKDLNWGGSPIRKSATGFGLVYFATYVLEGLKNGETLENKSCIVSGSGNVALACAQKLISIGAKIIAMSDSSGYIHIKEGLDEDGLRQLETIKMEKRGRIKEFLECTSLSVEYFAEKSPWLDLACDYAFPCATQNEIGKDEAVQLVKNGCKGVFEGANMPCRSDAVHYFLEHDVLYAPGKAANAGGVAVSALEMAQNSQWLQWTEEEVDSKLQEVMKDIYRQCERVAEAYGRPHDLEMGANIAGFVKVADSMLNQGVV